MTKENMTKLWVGYVVSFPHWSVLLFVRISIQRYSSTKARNDGDFRVERDTFLSEYHRHIDWSGIRLVTPAGSNMLCALSTVEERQACPFADFGFCIGEVLAWAADARTVLVQVVVLTLYKYEMECVKPLNPTMVMFRQSRDFSFYFW